MSIQDDIAEQVPGLRRYACALVGDRGCADDLVQDMQLEADLQVLNLEREVSLIWAQLEYQILPLDMTSDQ